MTTQQAYDEKNQQDYDDVTKRLNQALTEIEKNPKLPATQTEVARLSGVHRNTVRDREFPKTKLEDIKKSRKEKALQEKLNSRSKVDFLTEERDKLATEVIHWFSQYLQAKQESDDFNRQLDRQIEASEYYKKEFEKQKEEIQALRFKNEQLSDLLRDIKK